MSDVLLRGTGAQAGAGAPSQPRGRFHPGCPDILPDPGRVSGSAQVGFAVLLAYIFYDGTALLVVIYGTHSRVNTMLFCFSFLFFHFFSFFQS